MPIIFITVTAIFPDWLERMKAGAFECLTSLPRPYHATLFLIALEETVVRREEEKEVGGPSRAFSTR